jgi:hypothetical protein
MTDKEPIYVTIEVNVVDIWEARPGTNTRSASVLPLHLLEQIAKPIMGTKIIRVWNKLELVEISAVCPHITWLQRHAYININELGTKLEL